MRVAAVDRPAAELPEHPGHESSAYAGWVKYSALRDIIDVTGREIAGNITYGDVARAAAQTAIVIDDLASADPWRPGGGEIRSRAETVTEPHELIRSTPTA